MLDEKAQLSLGFVIRVLVGFTLLIALTYAVWALEDALKKEGQKQTLTSVSEYVAFNVIDGIKYLKENQTVNKTVRLPLSKDPFSGQYSVRLISMNNVLYVEATSDKWSDLTARYPLYMNSTHIVIDMVPSHPPDLCMVFYKSPTSLQINVTC